MISFKEAHKKVMALTKDYGTEKVFFTNSLGRVLAEDIKADRDFPPFNRATKDGIAINFSSIEKQQKQFNIENVVAAGTPQGKLVDVSNCVEIMTGAVLPHDADTVIMYEDISIENGIATLQKEVKKGQNIHKQGSDRKKDTIVVQKDTTISAGEIGILASVGKVEVSVKKLPKVTLISTGNELVAVHEKPAPHQIRGSNMLSLHALLQEAQIHPEHIHLMDDKEVIKNNLSELLQHNDVLLLSGGVSKGKYDYIPDVMEQLGVEKIFHKVLQRPGKPFWFGKHKKTETLIFSFPGNPVSTFANFHIYFREWLCRSLKIPSNRIEVVLGEDINNATELTLFKNVKLEIKNGSLVAFLINENGSGDLTSLAHTDGFIQLLPNKEGYKKGEKVPFYASRKLF